MQALNLGKLLFLIRNRKIHDAMKELKYISEYSGDIDRNSEDKIYEIGEIFGAYSSAEYIAFIDELIVRKESLILRFIRQEITYNDSENFDIDFLWRLNEEDLAKHPRCPYFIIYRAVLLWDQGKLEDAMKDVDQATTIMPKNTEFLRTRAMILADTGKYHEAQIVLQRALGIDYGNVDIKNAIEFVNRKEDEDERLEELRQEMDKYRREIRSDMAANMQKQAEQFINENAKLVETTKRALNRAKFDFVSISGMFVAILVIVDRMMTIRYEQVEQVDLTTLFLYHIIVNLPWIISLLFIVFCIGTYKRKMR